MTNVQFTENFDLLAWKYKGCSDKINKLLKMYHSDATEDLLDVVNHASKN